MGEFTEQASQSIVSDLLDEFCSFRERCGRSDVNYEDLGATGLLPFYEYPKEKVRAYLESRDSAKLTPTLSRCYPELTEEFEIHDWRCERCGTTFPYDSVDWSGDTSKTPVCPACSDDGVPATLRGDSVSPQNSDGV